MRARKRTESEIRALIAERARDRRLAQHLRQVDAAQALGISQSALSNYESGINAIPIEVLLGMTGLYHARLADFVSEADRWTPR